MGEQGAAVLRCWAKGPYSRFFTKGDSFEEGREIPQDWSYAYMSVGVQSGERLPVGCSPEFRGFHE